jgi:hypothetical protein
MNEPMISLIPTTAAPAPAGRAANGAGATGDAFAAKLQKAVNARQPAAVAPTDARTPAAETVANEQTANDEVTNDQSAKEPAADTEPDDAGDAAPRVDTAPRHDNDGTAATVTAATASIVAPLLVAPLPVALAAEVATPSSSTAPAATAVESSAPAAVATATPSTVSEVTATPSPVLAGAAASPSSTPAATAITPDPPKTVTAVATEAAAVTNGEPVAAKSADLPAPQAVAGGPVADNAVVTKGSTAGDPDDGDDSKRRHSGSARGTEVAAGGHLVGPAETVVPGNVANRISERGGAAPPSADPVATTPHADHQAIARAADVLTTGEHTGPMTTNRLALEMDGNSRVAVRMDDTGHVVHVDVLADPTGRLDGSWRADMSESLRNHGLELDQRGADTRGEGHHREDHPDDRFATDGGLPRKPVRSRPTRPGSLWL